MKKKKIILIAILLIVTLNINYIGMIEKKITITNKEYQTGNSSNLVLDKILSDNELKTEIPHMFNYASNRNYVDYDEWTTLNDQNYVTTGLYSNTDEDGTTYYYRGDINNNNLQFGAYDEDYYVYYYDNSMGADPYYQSRESCPEAGSSQGEKVKLASKGDKMYWKIVRINGDGSIRLIYNGPGVNSNNFGSMVPTSFSDEELSGVIGGVPYNFNLRTDDPKYTGYTYDNGTDSFIKKEIDTWYNNTLGSNPEYDKYVILGRFCSDTSDYHYDEYFGRNIFASTDRLRQADFDFPKDNAPTFACPNTSESYGGSYKLKAGLITADELVFAGESWAATGNSYLNPGQDGTPYWTMTPFDDRFMWLMDSNQLSLVPNDFVYGIRPVINLSTEGMTLVGDGTRDNPYVLVETANNSYKGKVTIEEGSSVDDDRAFTEEVDLSGNITWTSEDESVAKIEDGRILGRKEGITTIHGVRDDGTTYEIEVTVIKNPITISSTYIAIGLVVIIVVATILYLYYRKRSKTLENK